MSALNGKIECDNGSANGGVNGVIEPVSGVNDVRFIFQFL